MDNTKIEWCDATWNPVRGCTKVSDGCKFCYAEAMARRFCKPGQWGDGIATRLKGWTGRVSLDEEALLRPLRWKKPRKIFVTSTGDPFHGAVPDAWLDRMLAVMALTPQHTYLLLTKRPERMRDYLMDEKTIMRVLQEMAVMIMHAPKRQHSDLVARLEYFDRAPTWWPLPNLWLGVSVENQKAADERIQSLRETPAAKRFLSCEPLLGPIDLRHSLLCPFEGKCKDNCMTCSSGGIDWVIAGGESGRHARPMHPDWVRGLRDQCANAGVPFLFKQWGEWLPVYSEDLGDGSGLTFWPDDGGPLGRLEGRQAHSITANGQEFARVGKKAAGRLLDGQIHHDFPRTAQ
ncbi:MAG: phage Gp37/Gp68 family protein [Alphaproteobacteria bacterium]|nr:phage Gp37/Gp68 family protein [Alphaproteobacteria bacterium]